MLKDSDSVTSDTEEDESVYERFELTLAQLQELIENLSTSNKIVDSVSNVKLPDINIRPFSGDPQEWMSFFDLFSSLVLNNPKLKSDSEKFYYLKSLLRGQPLSLIESLPVTNQNLDVAISTLKNNYEDKNKLLNSLYQTLLDQKHINKCNASEIRNFYVTSKKTLDLIKNLRLSAQVTFETLLVFLLEKKLDFQSRRAFESERDLTALPSVDIFFEFLKKRYTILENLNMFDGSSKPGNSFSRNSHKDSPKVNFHAKVSDSTTRNSSSNGKYCSYCNERSHSTYVCTKFLKLSPQERHRFVKLKSLCFNCLSNMHILASCKSLSRCQSCGRDHHSLIHLETNSSRVGTQQRVQNVSQNSQSLRHNGNRINGSTRDAHLSNPSLTQNSNFLTQNSPANLLVSDTNIASNQGCSSIGTTNLSALSKNNCQILLPTAQAKVYSRTGKPFSVKLILDSGSQQSFISKDLANRLQYLTRTQKLSISGLGNNDLVQSNEILDIVLHSKINPYQQFDASCSVIDRITERLPQIALNPHGLKIADHLIHELADPHFWEPSNIDILIGADLYFSIVKGDLISLGHNQPTLLETAFGYVVAGPVPNLSHQNGNYRVPTTHSFLSVQDENNLTVGSDGGEKDICSILEKFWELEELPSRCSRSEEEEMAETLLAATTKILESGRYQVEMPLACSGVKQLGDSFTIAKRRFLTLEKKFLKDHSFFREYKKTIEEYLSLEHAKVIPLTLTNCLNENKYFIPHRAVIKEGVSSTKFRVVFDFSAKSSSGFSLNELTLKGFQVQDNLFDILCRFRTYKFVLTADINKMYRIIEMFPHHRYLQNILWRDSPSEDFKCIELSRVSFGQNCSPFLATRVIKDIALRNSQAPLASKALLKQTYMDDILGGTDKFHELRQFYSELNAVLNKHGFYLHKWCSNVPSFLQEISQSDTAEFDLSLEEAPYKILGLKWNPIVDTIKISANTSIDLEPITKRRVLSCISSCYDPLGIVNPLIVNGKLLMQELWKLRVNWDDPITDPMIFKRWKTFLTTLAKVNNIELPRFIFVNKKITKIDIHGFCDASLTAFGACIYLVAQYSDNSLSSNLITAKSRVAPLKNKLTIPKLELCAMELLSKLVHQMISILSDRVTIDTINYWSDSQIALSWIKNPANSYMTFVANRVSTIQSLSMISMWRHIRSHLNPADMLTRGNFDENMLDFWLHGPEFLRMYSFDFDNFNSFSPVENLPEIKKISLVISDKVENSWTIMFARFSKFSKLQHSVAYVFRFIYNLKNKQTKMLGPLTVDELSHAHMFIVRQVQSENFSKEFLLLTSNKPIDNKQLLSLNPFIDKTGILRVGGRLQNATIDDSQKFPILLPANNHVVSLLIKREHCRLGHTGPQNVLGNLRLRYWPLSGIKQVKRIIKQCLTCYRFNAHTASQIMAPLPIDRVQNTRVFSKTGVDFAGPVYIRSSRLRKAPNLKCYIALFVCMATKAIHIELVSDLTTNSFLASLKRFISRRGNPQIIFSDNGTNFVGANNQLRDLYDFFKSQSNFDNIRSYLDPNEIRWKFIPPRSPHWGGLWESAIKSAKYHLVRLVGNSRFTFEEMYTILTQIEAVLNSRPLYPLSNDPNDLQPLTPGHFLIGSSLTAYPDFDLTCTNTNRLTAWQQCQQIQQSFWKRWSVDYLNNLQNRPKWLRSLPNIQVNDLVLVKSEDTIPLRWPLGRVIATIPGKDGKVRVVRLKTADGEYTRSITKVIVLPIGDKVSC
ncbi:uncharacterized protein [Diabrotica undecimpunctata]|uniref:uncharacterized protein n=1 Tax=Diabrotica undecimpunctata TaxID=50387 RepID=UPI003B6332B5